MFLLEARQWKQWCQNQQRPSQVAKTTAAALSMRESLY